MRYKKEDEIYFDEDQEKLSRLLKKRYGYPLLNFANVIADVLADDTIFTKTIGGRGYKSIKTELDSLKQIKMNLFKSLEKHFSLYMPKIYDKEFQRLNDDLKEQFFSIGFKLKPFLDELAVFINPLERLIGPYKNKPELISWPDKTKSSRAFSCVNQISFIWAQIMFSGCLRKTPDSIPNIKEFVTKYPLKFQIHWGKISNLLLWFHEHLRNASYFKKLFFGNKAEFTGNLAILKNQYENIKKKYIWLLMISRLYSYFPPTKIPLIPEGKWDFSSEPKGKPIISVVFYNKKIEKIIKDNEKLLVKEISFIKGKPYSIIREYVQADKKEDKNKLLLRII